MAKGGTLSCIVPHLTHVDQTEQDLAGLRGLSACERAPELRDTAPATLSPAIT